MMGGNEVLTRMTIMEDLSLPFLMLLTSIIAVQPTSMNGSGTDEKKAVRVLKCMVEVAIDPDVTPLRSSMISSSRKALVSSTPFCHLNRLFALLFPPPQVTIKPSSSPSSHCPFHTIISIMTAMAVSMTVVARFNMEETRGEWSFGSSTNGVMRRNGGQERTCRAPLPS